MGNSDSKLSELRERIETLIDSRTPIIESAYWDGLITQPLLSHEIEELLPFSDVRRARQNLSPNLSHFFMRILQELNKRIDRGTYGQLSKHDVDVLLTGVRLLTRIMPVLLEVPTPDGLYAAENGDISGVDERQRSPSPSWLGSSSQSATTPASTSGGEPSMTRAEMDFVHALFWQARPTSDGVNMSEEDDERCHSVLGIQILTTLQRLLFLKGFTILAPSVVLPRGEPLPKHKVDSRFLWKGGIGAIKDSVVFETSQLYQARTEVLRCLIACLSSTLYLSVREYQTVPPSIWLWVFTRGFLPYTANLYCSLMSTVFSYVPKNPGYTGLFGSSSEETELVAVCLQLLCILVDFNSPQQQQQQPPQQCLGGAANRLRSSSVEQPNGILNGPQQAMTQISVDPKKPSPPLPPQSDDVTQQKLPSRSMSSGSVGNYIPAPTVRNAYRLMLSAMKQPSEADMVFQGTIRLLRAVAQQRHIVTRETTEPMAFHQELLVLFWHLVTLCPSFTRHICSRCDANQLLTPLLVIVLEASSSRRMEKAAENDTTQRRLGDSDAAQEKVGLLHLCSFILLLLSSEREFAVRLNDPYREKFPLQLPAFNGSYADLLVLTFYRIILDTLAAGTQDSLIDMLLTVLCNVSAYIKSFCLESCVKLMNLISRFSKQTWIFKAPYHYHNLFFLLDLLNNAIQYQYEGNLKLVYAILRQKNLFLDFHNMSWPSAASTAGSSSPGLKETPTSPFTDGGGAESSIEASPGVLSLQDLENWQPTETWFLDWKSKAPIHTILRLINCLLPMVEAECIEKGLTNQDEVLEFLKRTTMVGLLPVPHAIIIRSYHPNAYTALWFTTYTWGVIATRCGGLFDRSKIRFLSMYQLQ